MNVTRKWAVCLAFITGACLLPAVSRSAPIETIGGWEGDGTGTGYGYLILGVPIPIGSTWDLPARFTASYLYYEFGPAPTTTRVRSPGAAASIGPRLHGTWGSLSLLGGAEVRWERRELGDPSPSVTKTRPTGAIAQMDADLALSRRWHTLALGSYEGAARYLWGRAALRYQLTNPDWSRPTTTFTGVEVIRQGNDESSAYQAGGFVEISLARIHSSVALHGGFKDRWSTGAPHTRGAYLGAGLYRRF